MRFIPPSINKYNNEFMLVGNISIPAYYLFKNLGYSSKENKHLYLIHIIIPDSLSVSKFNNVFKAEEFVIDRIRKIDSNITKDNTKVVYLLDLPKKIKFWFDVQMSDFVFKKKEQIIKDKDIDLGEIYVLLSPDDIKTKVALETAAKIFVPKYKPLIYTNLEDVMSDILELVK